METGLVDSLLREERVFRPLPQVVREANMGQPELRAAQKLADADYRLFWEEQAAELDWFEKWDQVLDESNPPFYKWFLGGKCNLVHNALDRHILTANKNKLAIIWEGESGECRKYTYYELFREVCRLANALRAMGVQKGDRILIYLPPLPETVITMLAAAKIGAVQTLVFAGYSARSLRERIESCQPKIIVTADGFYRNGRVINLKSVVDEALFGQNCDCVESVIVVHRAGVELDMVEPRDLRYEDLCARSTPRPPPRSWTPRTRCFCCSPPGPRASPRASCTPTAATWWACTPPTAGSWTSNPRTSISAPPTPAG